MNKLKYIFQMHRYTNLVPFIITLFFLSSMTNSSCKHQSKNENIRSVDSIISMVYMAQNVLILDSKNIKIRIDSMKIRIQKLDSLDKLRMNQEMLLDYTSYKALFKNYSNFINEYEILVYDNSRLNEELTSLKQKTVDADINNEDFQKYYLIYHNDCLIHLHDSRNIVRNILSQEKMYQRINVKLTEFLSNS